MSTALQEHVAHGGVTEATAQRLLALVESHGWTPMLSEPEPGLYRVWLRNRDGRRMFGRWADTAEGAVLLLIDKVEPMARARAAVR